MWKWMLYLLDMPVSISTSAHCAFLSTDSTPLRLANFEDKSDLVSIVSNIFCHSQSNNDRTWGRICGLAGSSSRNLNFSLKSSVIPEAWAILKCDFKFSILSLTMHTGTSNRAAIIPKTAVLLAGLRVRGVHRPGTVRANSMKSWVFSMNPWNVKKLPD